MATGADVGDTIPKEWTRFVLETCGGDQETADALQIAVGASAFGDNRDHAVNVLQGDGGTGKTTFIETVTAALGDYAGRLPPSVLNGRHEQHPTGMAGIIGKRLVVATEVGGGMWRSQALAEISGGDTLRARFMRKDFFDFAPVCTVWVLTNLPPSLHLVDKAMRRRLRMWPLDHQPETRDVHLPKRLRRDLPGVLRWIVEGAAKYSELGAVPECPAVRAATANYFDETDTIAGWLAERTDANGWTKAATLYQDYEEWCKGQGYRPTGRPGWGTALARKAERKRLRGGSTYALSLRVPE